MCISLQMWERAPPLMYTPPVPGFCYGCSGCSAHEPELVDQVQGFSRLEVGKPLSIGEIEAAPPKAHEVQIVIVDTVVCTRMPILRVELILRSVSW